MRKRKYEPTVFSKQNRRGAVMARARNIKPSFFNNDLLADIEPLGRLLFIGLWTVCDYKGNLEFREKKIKASLLPYDSCSVMDIAINLEKSGFIQSYSNAGVIYINIVNFSKHQNPHKNERLKGSDTPDISDCGSQLYDLKEDCIKSEKVAINPDNNETNPADSFNLIPDSSSLKPSCSEFSVQPEAKRGKYKFNEDQMNFASAMYQAILKVAPATKKPNLEAWANTARMINEIDGINLMDAWNVFAWANRDPFWQTNILSADKFRKQYAQLSAKMNSNSTGSSRDIMQESADSNWHEGDLGL